MLRYIYRIGSKEEFNNVKKKCLQADGRTTGRTDRLTDDEKQAIRKVHLNLWLR